jgi:hypothetical protein
VSVILVGALALSLVVFVAQRTLVDLSSFTWNR